MSGKCFLAIFFLSILPVGALADLAYVEPKTLIKESDLIVIGTLTNVTERTVEDTVYAEGVITIRQLVAGNIMNSEDKQLGPGDAVVVKWERSAWFACTMGMHKDAENVEGEWLLTIENETARADRPQSFSPAEFSEIDKLLKAGVSVRRGSKRVRVFSNPTEIENDLASLKPEGSRENRSDDYAPYSALLVFMASVMLYMILYRNRFK